jgi:hypothetical protein
LKKWYGHQTLQFSEDDELIPASVLTLLRGDASQRALIAWHMGWEPAKKTSDDDWLVPYLGVTLDDSYSVVRYIGQRSLRRLHGMESLRYDYIAPSPQRIAAQTRALQTWRALLTPAQAEKVLSKILKPDTFTRLLKQRDNHPMQLLE